MHGKRNHSSSGITRKTPALRYNTLGASVDLPTEESPHNCKLIGLICSTEAEGRAIDN